jgi:hypothetical protein
MREKAVDYIGSFMHLTMASNSLIVLAVWFAREWGVNGQTLNVICDVDGLSYPLIGKRAFKTFFFCTPEHQTVNFPLSYTIKSRAKKDGLNCHYRSITQALISTSRNPSRHIQCKSRRQAKPPFEKREDTERQRHPLSIK